MNGRDEKRSAIDQAMIASLKLDVAERSIASDEKAAGAVPRLEAAFLLACRNVTNVIDDLPPGEQPKGWVITPDRL